MATLLESAQINKREDLSDLISIADASATVFSTMIPKGAELGNRKFEWQVDSYDAASSVSVKEGLDVDVATGSAFVSNGVSTVDPRAAAARIGNHGHYWRRAFRVGPLAAESNTAGYKSEISNGLAKKTIELKRDIEKTLLGTQCAVAGVAATTASETRGMGMWTSTIVTSGGTDHGATTFGTNDATYASWTGTPAPFLVPAGSRTTTATGSLTDTIVQDILASIFTKTGTPQGFDLIAGTTLRRAFTNLVVNATTVVNATMTAVGATNATGTGSTTVTSARSSMNSFEQDTQGATFKSTIDVFQGDFGTVRVHSSNFMPTAFCGYVVPMDTVQLRYGFMPRVKNLTDNGGGEGRLIEAFAGLVVKNPLNLGRFGATS